MSSVVWGPIRSSNRGLKRLSSLPTSATASNSAVDVLFATLLEILDVQHVAYTESTDLLIVMNHSLTFDF